MCTIYMHIYTYTYTQVLKPTKSTRFHETCEIPRGPTGTPRIPTRTHEAPHGVLDKLPTTNM